MSAPSYEEMIDYMTCSKNRNAVNEMYHYLRDFGFKCEVCRKHRTAFERDWLLEDSFKIVREKYLEYKGAVEKANKFFSIGNKYVDTASR